MRVNCELVGYSFQNAMSIFLSLYELNGVRSLSDEIIAVPEGSTSCLESDGSNISQGKAVAIPRLETQKEMEGGSAQRGIVSTHSLMTQTTKGCLHLRSMISVMKPPLSPSMSDGDVKDMKMKKKVKAVENDNNMEGQAHFDNNFMFEVLKHVDAWTLVMSGCLNK
ncbi:hypothetical protein JHK84_044584 [Glycine max]|nr:hypothetical protein JHK85_045071 [Glycine max]KAG5107677.1 hypothetical protein JHK84_044584 [Glycine max]